MTRPHPLGDRERALLNLYASCQMGLSPRRFYAKWNVSYEAIANICARSTPTVRRWFSQGQNYRSPSPNDLRHLAMMDFLLEHFEELPLELLALLCPEYPRAEVGNSDDSTLLPGNQDPADLS